jgi:hypothetical protein
MNNTSLNLVSLNVRGLGKDPNSIKQKSIRRWMASFTPPPPPPQILLLQEHHLNAADYNAHTKGIEFWKGEALWNPGIPMGSSDKPALEQQS